MSSASPSPRRGPLGLSPAAAGTVCCIVSVLGYSTANVCLRRLCDLGCDPTWAIAAKETVAVLLVGPWFLIQALRGVPVLPTGRPLAILIAVGLATQLGGNAAMQWALGIAGLAVMIPALFAFLLTASAVLGWLLLGEGVSGRSLAAIGLLLVSLVLLGIGATGAGHGAAAPGELADHPALLAAAIGAACLAGIIYSLLSIAIRHCVTRDTQWPAVVVIITGMGTLTLTPLSLWRLGVAPILATPWEQYACIVAAGLCNLVAFIALIRGLELITVVHANMLNAGQVAAAAVCGILLFREPPNLWLAGGVALTIAGIFAIGRPAGEEPLDPYV